MRIKKVKPAPNFDMCVVAASEYAVSCPIESDTIYWKSMPLNGFQLSERVQRPKWDWKRSHGLRKSEFSKVDLRNKTWRCRQGIHSVIQIFASFNNFVFFFVNARLCRHRLRGLGNRNGAVEEAPSPFGNELLKAIFGNIGISCSLNYITHIRKL